MDTIDESENISTQDEAPIGSYHNMEGLWPSRLPKQPFIRYVYGNHIHVLLEYTQHSLKKLLKLFK